MTSTDYVPALLERGRRRAEAEGLDVTFEVADAEALPYPTASFDVILSTFGVMFAPDHAQAASEMLRVCRPGGRIGLASWTPEGFLGELFRVVAKHVPPMPGVRSPLLWGTDCAPPGAVRGRDVDRAHGSALRVPVSIGGALRRGVPDVLRTGPTRRSRRSTPNGQAALEADLIALLRQRRSRRRVRSRRAGGVSRDGDRHGEDAATDVRPRPPRR